MDGGHRDLGGRAGCEPRWCAPAARAARAAARTQAMRFAPLRCRGTNPAALAPASSPSSTCTWG